MNFKGVQTLWEKLDKFTKILSQHGLNNGEFSFLHLYARSWSSNTCVKVSWFENNKGVWIWNSNHTTHIIHTKPIHDFIQASKSHSELLFKHCSYYSDTRDLTTLPPLTEISSWDLEGAAALIGIVNSRIFPHYGNTKSKWQERRKSSLSHVASSLVWLLHFILKNLIVLRLMTRSFWSKTLIGCSGYDKSASSGVTLGNTMSMGVFKHYFNCDMWKISWTPAKDGSTLSL
jgi:hypothetical protein